MTEPTLILIPGWGMEELVWEAFLSHLHDFSVHVVHWRNSENGQEFQRRIIEVAEGKEVILVGWSLGALAALQVHHLLQTKGIVLLGGTAKFTTDSGYIHGWKKPFVERMNRNLLKQKDDTLKRFYVSMFSKEEQENGQDVTFLKIAEQFQGDSIHSLQCGLQYLIEADVREQLLQIDVPVLLLHGKDDMICPLTAAEYIQGEINASLTIIEDAGHALCFTQAKRCAKRNDTVCKGDRAKMINKTLLQKTI